MADVDLMTNPMTTAGDVVYGGASGAPTRLAIGTAGQILKVNAGATALEYGDESSSSGGYDEGTTFPVSPSSGDKYYRTDRNLLYYYDGTRWLTTTLYVTPFGMQDNLQPLADTSVERAVSYIPTMLGEYDVWLVKFKVMTIAAATNNGSNYWTVKLGGSPSATVHKSFTTAADTAGTKTAHDLAVGALTGTTDVFLQITQTDTGSPGTLYCFGAITYRLVG